MFGYHHYNFMTLKALPRFCLKTHLVLAVQDEDVIYGFNAIALIKRVTRFLKFVRFRTKQAKGRPWVDREKAQKNAQRLSQIGISAMGEAFGRCDSGRRAESRMKTTPL